ncbi:response regulator transcription factor [Roseibium aggregatum]|uniref:Response regulator transcription factor n=1 Tax=Roseibium aggregatum TaxID=187304 RepID=A0A926S505_9HYPH|nr:response regulator transcription factor [Roseibium aggregatum]MBD1545650.1 response regulator transcription factor [Roseibium aggregatum]
MRIVIIEDNKTLARGLSHRLKDIGHAVDLLHDGSDGDSFLADEGADLVILDINLPGKDGLEVLKNLRGRGDNTPVLLLTARGETKDRVTGLDLGADDYLVKPFEAEELEARVRALARRRNTDGGAPIKVGKLQFDRGARRLFRDGAAMELPRRELAVLECLIDRRGQLVPKRTLADHVYGLGTEIEEKVIEIYISRLRKRLEGHGLKIRTARGLGYYFEEEE